MSGPLLRNGRYEIVATLAEGGQGTTFDARESSNGRRVAIKRFSIRGARSWKDVELAEREAHVLASLSHPALPVYVDHFEEDGALYLVMEKIEGETLDALCRREGALARADVERFLADAANVLDYLHGRSPPVIHRDINPKNVIRRPDGSFAFVDFGAVRARLKPDGGSTVVGTFGYMAAEQFQGRALPASDVYAVGVTTLRLLTGVEPDQLPHRGLSLDVAAALGSNVEPELRSMLERMLELDPDQRASRIQPLLDDYRSARRHKDERASAANAASSRSAGAGERAARDRQHHHAQGERSEHGTFQGAQWARGAHPRLHRDWFEAREAFQEAQRVAREAFQEAQHVAREERHQAQHAARGARRDARRRAARESRRRRRQAGGRGGLHGLPLAFAVLGIQVALLVVGMVLGFVVPLVLSVLSVFFGPGLRRAAWNVRRAEGTARDALLRARSFVVHGSEAAAEPRVRVETNAAVDVDAEVRHRVVDEATGDEQEEETGEPEARSARQRR